MPHAGSPAPAEHIVRFYGRDDSLCEAIADYVADGIRAHERVVVIATAVHRGAVEKLLRSKGDDAGVTGERLIHVDADEMLARVTANGVVSPQLFRAQLTSILEQAPPPVRVFGEIVSLVALVGQLDAALEIEAMGNELTRTAGVNVLCAYHLGDLGGGQTDVDRVVACHDRAIGAPRA